MRDAGETVVRDPTNGARGEFPDALVVTTVEGRILSWNAGAWSLFGYAGEEAVGRSLFGLTIPAENVTETETWLRTAAEAGFAVCVSTRRRKDGSVVQVHGSARAAPDETHGVVLVLIERDLAGSRDGEVGGDQRIGDAVAEQFVTVLDVLPDAVLVVDAGGRISALNEHAERLFGYTREEILGREIELLVPPDLRAAHERYRIEYGRAPTPRPMGSGLHLRGRRRDGEEFFAEISLGPFTVAGASLVIAVVRDVTERLRAQDARRALAERSALEQRVRERTRELQATQDALRATNRELEAFTYSVSHDLRAPIRRIEGFSRILAEEFSAELKPPARHCVERIRDGVQHMAHLVDDLLHLARVGRRELRPRLVAVDALVREVLLALAGDIGDRNIEWRLHPLPTLECDAGLLKVAFTNLLGNAIKYTRSRERAVIEVGQLRGDGRPVLYVRDNGVGFEMKYADELFGVFQRLHGSHDFEGTGVGLATVQRIVHKHGGEVWAEAEPDRGACFYFTLGNVTT